jgi:cysteine desulfurase/selenocysteine lyase
MSSLTEHTKATIFDVERIRKDFPILSTSMHDHPLAFLDSAASSQKPKAVIETLDQYYREQHCNVHRGVYKLSQDATNAFEEARRKAQRFLNAASEGEVIFTRGTTEGINLVAQSFGRKFFREGDEIILSEMEHHSNIVPWQLIAEQTGAKIRVIPINDAGELDLDAYREMLNTRTKMVSIVHISNSLGTINPIEEMIQLAHEKDIPFLVDGAQSAQHMKIDVQAMDADFFVCSGHKIMGPTGIGLLYGKEKWLNAMPPYHGGGEMIDRVTFEKTTYNVLPHKFEAGTPHIAGVIGLGAAIDYMESIGFEAIGQHEQFLLDYATEKLLEIEGLKIYGTAKEKASVISFLVDGVHPYDLGMLIDRLGVAVRTGHHCCQPLMDRFGIPGTIRASFAFYNNTQDIDQLVAALNRTLPMLR